jgi:hypothetical protein
MPPDSTARLAALLVLLWDAAEAAEPPAAAAARLAQLPAWLLGALPLSLLEAEAGSTRPGTMASATLPRARLLGRNLTTRRLLPVMVGTSLSCGRDGVINDSEESEECESEEAGRATAGEKKEHVVT